MRDKVGDKIRVRGDLGVGKVYDGITFRKEMGEKCIFEVVGVEEEKNCIVAKNKCCLTFSSEMLRPAEFKIWCETEEEKQAVLEELKKEGYVWYNSKEKPTEKDLLTPVGILVWEADFENDTTITYTKSIKNFDKKEYCQFTPSEFTGINLSEKIIITKTPTGATAIYGDKTVTTEGDFNDASRQALAEILCPFKVGDRVIDIDGYVGRVKKIEFENHRKNTVYVDGWDCNSSYSENELRLYTEPLYNAKLFCIEGSNLSADDYFKKGYIYEVKNGRILGYECTGVYKDIEHVNNVLVAQFMEVKGGLDD